MRAIYLFVVFMLFIHPGLFAQETYNVRFGLGYPFTNNHFFSLYTGQITTFVGAGYEFKNNLHLGVEFDFSQALKSSSSMTLSYFSSVLYSGYRIGIGKSVFINPEAGAGYGNLKLKSDDYHYNSATPGILVKGKLNAGYNFNRFDLTAFYQFNYLYLNKDATFTSLDYFRNQYFSSIGLGVTFKIFRHDKKD
jgi:hypothetical protein